VESHPCAQSAQGWGSLAAPTTQQTATFTDLEKAPDEQLSAWDQLKSKDVPELNKQLKKACTPVLDLQKPGPKSEDQVQSTLKTVIWGSTSRVAS
jgi:hypothetical protein